MSDEIQSAIVSRKATEIGLIKSDNIGYPIVIRQGINEQGKTIRYYLNYSDKELSVKYNSQSGTSLLDNRTLKKNDLVTLKPWDVAIIEE